MSQVGESTVNPAILAIGGDPDFLRVHLPLATSITSVCSEEVRFGAALLDRRQPPRGPLSNGLLKSTLCVQLKEAYNALVPGGVLLVLADSNTSGTSRFRNTDRRDREEIALAIYKAGFESPRFLDSSPTSVSVLACRGASKPPPERVPLLSVVIPAYNERETFTEVMQGLLAKSIDGALIEIIVVESNSTDGTRDAVLELQGEPRVTVLLEDAPRGKGHAVRTGLRHARGDFVLIQDADLEYSLDDYEALLGPLRAFESSFVLGRRMIPHGKRGMRHFHDQTLASHAMNLGHTLFLMLFNAVYRQQLQDPFTMYKVFRRDCIAAMVLECNRFDFDWELTAKLIRAGFHPIEIPVSYHSRSFSEGKKIRVLRDPVSWIAACARYRFASLYETFEPSSYVTQAQANAVTQRTTTSTSLNWGAGHGRADGGVP